MIADVEGDMIDIVVQDHVNDETCHGGRLLVNEVIQSLGAIYGGMHTNSNFLIMLHCRIGCLEVFLIEHLSMVQYILLQWWEHTKCGFDGTCLATFDLPCNLARAWKAYDISSNINSYDEIKFSVEDMCKYFDLVVDKILDVISTQTVECKN